MITWSINDYYEQLSKTLIAENDAERAQNCLNQTLLEKQIKFCCIFKYCSQDLDNIFYRPSYLFCINDMTVDCLVPMQSLSRGGGQKSLLEGAKNNGKTNTMHSLTIIRLYTWHFRDCPTKGLRRRQMCQHILSTGHLFFLNVFSSHMHVDR